MMKTLALYQLKGGVGKTSSAVNLAAMAAADGIQTLLWDLDPQAAASWYFDIAPPAGADKPKQWLSGQTPIGRWVQRTAYDHLDLLPAAQSNRLLDVLLRKVEPPRRALAKLLEPFSEHYQLVILDAPPSLSHLADNILTAADRVLMPIIPGYLSWRTAEQVLHYAKEIEVPARKFEAFYCMVDRRRSLHREQLDAPPAAAMYLHPTAIPYASSVERMGAHRAPLAAFAPAEDPALLAFASLWMELRQRLGLRA
jgi:chromosome partitioning protein